jgi:hypothetical protein
MAEGGSAASKGALAESAWSLWAACTSD